MNDGDPTFTESAHHNDRIPFLEYKYDEFPQWEGLGILKKLKSPRLIKSHLPVSLFPKSALYKGCKVIYVARNPKDVVVSYYHFYKTTVEFGEYGGDFHDFLKQFMNGKVHYGDWFTYMLEWWKYIADNDILFLKYEDMKKDPRLATVKIANYLNRNLSDEVIDKITEYCSFKKMKKHVTNENNEGNYMRKGVIGDWKKHFTVAENEAFEKIYNERMEGSGLKFDW
uniref:Sulfotransferase family cytosolic 1B member 1-like n=1 Tax=Saccoglossus kowalevskii TaxID=10224 RepID=A0ABM0M5L5_SACKO|nr:PREDICTED: sulfotransferase family cytosolic 1B member 1-like [Saccoglossus kowalevskii]